MGFEDGQALAIGSITAGRVHVGGEGGLIQHDQMAQFLRAMDLCQVLRTFDHIKPLLPHGHNRFFTVKPNRRRARHTVRGNASTRSLSLSWREFTLGLSDISLPSFSSCFLVKRNLGPCFSFSRTTREPVSRNRFIILEANP